MANSEPTRSTRRRGLRTLVLPLLLALAVAAPAPAQAAVDLGPAIATAKSVFPTVRQRCGGVSIEIGPLNILGASAESYFRSCLVRIAPAPMTTATNAQMC